MWYVWCGECACACVYVCGVCSVWCYECVCVYVSVVSYMQKRMYERYGNGNIQVNSGVPWCIRWYLAQWSTLIHPHDEVPSYPPTPHPYVHSFCMHRMPLPRKSVALTHTIPNPPSPPYPTLSSHPLPLSLDGNSPSQASVALES